MLVEVGDHKSTIVIFIIWLLNSFGESRVLETSKALRELLNNLISSEFISFSSDKTLNPRPTRFIISKKFIWEQSINCIQSRL